MKQLIVVALVVLAASAVAQAPLIDPCTGAPYPPPPAPQPLYMLGDYDIDKPPPCEAPRPGAWNNSAKGLVEWRYCLDRAKNRYFPQWQVTTAGDLLNVGMVRDALLAGWPNIDEAGRVALAKKYRDMIKPLSHPENAAVWCPFWPEIARGIPAVALSSHVVGVNGTTYPMVNGVRSTQSNGAVPSGEACDGVSAALKDRYVFARSVSTPAGSVVLCVPRR